MRILVWSVAAFLFLSFCMPAHLAAQNVGALDVEDLLSSREFGQLTLPVLSPDQGWLVYPVKRKLRGPQSSSENKARIPAYWREVDLWARNTRTSETKCLTGGVGDNGAPAWSPDGRYLAFLSDRDGSEVPNLWLWERATDKLIRVSDKHVRSNELQWLNNREILITLPPENLILHPGDEWSDNGPPSESTSQGASVRVYRSEGKPAVDGSKQFAPPWDLDAYRKDLATIEVASGNVRRLTHDGRRIAKFAVSPDGAHIAFSSPVRFERADSQQIRWDLIVVSMASKDTRTLASDVRFQYDGTPFSWSPDGLRLAYMAAGPLERNSTGDCFVIDLKASEPRNISRFTSPPARQRQRAPLWNEAGDALYFIRHGALWTVTPGSTPRELARINNHVIREIAANKQRSIWTPRGSAVVLTYDSSAKQSGFYRIDLRTGDSTRLLENGHCYDCENVDDHIYTGKDKFAFFAEDAGSESNLWLADGNFRHPIRLTQLNPQLQKYKMGKAQLVQWHSLDGRPLQGTMLLPPDYRKEQRYPLVVWIYGGNSGSDYLNRFGIASGTTFNMQLLATRGYAVLYPDVPQDLSAPMLDIAKAVLPGISHLIECGIADPERLAVMGQSYGGYSTLALIVQSKQFKAAIEMDGLSNLISGYGQMGKDGDSFGVSWSERGQGLMGGTPWQLRGKYIENSPYFYLDRVEAPVLIVHGAGDTTITSFLGDELFVALRRLGKEVEYAKYEGEDHSAVYWKYPNQVDLCRRMLTWLGRHLGTNGN